MRKLLLIFTITCLSLVAKAVTFTSTITGGDWNTGSTWDLGTVPTSSDDVVINGPVTVDNNKSCLSLVINSTTTLTINSGKTLSVNSFITNNGTISGSAGILELATGTTQTISGTGSATIGTMTTANGGTRNFTDGEWTITTLTTNGGKNLSFSGIGIFTIGTINHGGTGTVSIGSTGTHTLTNVNVSGGTTCTLTVSKTPYNVAATENWNISNGTVSFAALTNNSANFTIGVSGTVTISNTLTNNATITSTGIFSLIGSTDRIVNGTGTATIANLTTANSGNKTFNSGTWTITSLTTGGGGNLIFDGPALTVTTLSHTGTGNITFKNAASVFSIGTLIHESTSNGEISFNDANYSLSLTNFTMNTVSVKGCDMVKDVIITGTLTLTQGKIFLGSGAQLTANTIIGGSSISYIVPSPGASSTGSRLKRDVGTSPTTFPIGTSSSYAPVTVTFPSTNTFTARVSSSFANVLPNPEGSIKLEWTLVDGSPVGGTATLVLTWNASDVGTSFEAMNALAYRYSGGAWGAKGGTVSGNSISVNTTNFSPWAVFSPAALPVTLSRFSAKEVEGKALLEWTSIQEINNRGFDIEKSLNAKDFVKIGFKDGAGNSDRAHLYSFIDDELADVSYYRLKQVDMDGGFTYSKIAVVVPQGASDELMVSPNPSNDKLKISIKGTIQQVNLLNLNGQFLLSKNTKIIDITDLPNGMYLLQVVTENGVKTKKVVKQ